MEISDYYVKCADLQMAFVCNSWIYVKCRFQSARFATRKTRRLQIREPPFCMEKRGADLQLRFVWAARICKFDLYGMGGFTFFEKQGACKSGNHHLYGEDTGGFANEICMGCSDLQMRFVWAARIDDFDICQSGKHSFLVWRLWKRSV